MIVTPIKTRRVLVSGQTIQAVLDEHLPPLKEGSIVAVTSKIVSLCEGRVVSMDEPLEEVVIKEADFYLPADIENYNQRFTITRHTLTARAGIDLSPQNNYYILLPQDPQATANSLRRHLANKFGLKNIGLIITDSISTPLRRGVTGISIAHSGFAALNDYRASRANVAGGLAAAAVVVMGEGSETTPLAVISDLPLVEFQDRDPTTEELRDLYVNKDQDFFAPFINSVEWQKGQRDKTDG